MSEYRRPKTTGGIYFFTVVTKLALHLDIAGGWTVSDFFDN